MRSSPGTEPEQDSRPDPVEPSQDELRAQLEQLRAQLDATEDRYLRARADLDNYRKRIEREVDLRTREERDVLLRSWLEVVDSVERAVAHTPDNDPTGDALRAVLEQMRSTLARERVMRIGAVGEPFDPERHEAIAVVEDAERKPGTVAEVTRSGYAVGDRVLRPAQVAVARPPAQAD
jgi:molecular chaperone GrpE